MAYLAPIFDLAEAWPEVGKRKFSIKRWMAGRLKDRDGKIPPLILQGNKSMKQLAAGLHASIIRIAAQYVCSPMMPESNTRRVWWMLDEFPQLGKIEAIGDVLDVGRSKGMRVVLLAQTHAQIKKTYGEELANSWSSLGGSIIIGRTTGPAADDLINKVIGTRIIDRHTISVSRSIGKGGGATRSSSVSRDPKYPVMLANELESDLGETPKNTWKTQGMRILWLTGDYVLRLLIPFTTPKILRPASVLAPWVTMPNRKARLERFIAACSAGGGVQANTPNNQIAAEAAKAEEARPPQEQQQTDQPALSPEDLDAIQQALGLAEE